MAPLCRKVISFPSPLPTPFCTQTVSCTGAWSLWRWCMEFVTFEFCLGGSPHFALAHDEQASPLGLSALSSMCSSTGFMGCYIGKKALEEAPL